VGTTFPVPRSGLNDWAKTGVAIMVVSVKAARNAFMSFSFFLFENHPKRFLALFP